MSDPANFEALIEKLTEKNSLAAPESAAAAEALAGTEISAEAKKRFLVALAQKGEAPEEIAAFAETFRGLARDPGLSDYAAQAIDVVGTGGDKSGSFNISSTTSFILASLGVTVLKHGNRSITSKCGSAQLIEAIGVDLQADSTQVKESVEALNYAFFFAPAYHPAFKEIMPVRQALAAEGQRTIFNMLGPLINPAQPAQQLLGVFASEWVSPFAQAMQALGLKRGLVVNSDLGGGSAMDELSLAGENHVAGFGSLAEVKQTWSAGDWGLAPCSVESLKGGDVAENLKILEALMAGTAPQGLADTVALNAGAGLWIMEKAASIEAGVALAQEALTGGLLKDWLQRVKAFYQA